MRTSVGFVVRIIALGGLLALAVACGSEDSVAVRVDYDHDEFATQFIRYFPDLIEVHPGDTVVFRQDWTGEAHTVTLGRAVDEVLSVTKPLIEEYGDRPEEEVPQEVLDEFFEAECNMITLYGCEESESDGPPELNQTIAQPCVIEEGAVPDDGQPCPDQDLGPFDGTEDFYNSGFLGFETTGENVFELEVSDSIQPGDYYFVCSVHGSFHSGTLRVAPPDQAIPTPEEVNLEARQQLNEVVEPFREAYAAASAGKFVYGGQSFTGNFSGLVDDRVQGLLNEFVPETITAGVGEPVTWLMFGPHSISFDVPEYFPIYEKLEDGTIRANEDVYLPAGGAPEVPEQPPGDPLVIDGGTWDGSGFWSSGVLSSDSYVQYTLRFATPGEYRFACLIHPPMVGTVTVSG